MERIARASLLFHPGGVALADRNAARPHQAVAVDDAVGIVAVAAVADRAAIGHHRFQPRAQGLGHAGIGGDGHQRVGDPLGDGAEIDVPGEHDAAGAHPPMGGGDALAHAGGIDRERRGVLEDVDAGAFGCVGKRQRIGQRVDLERVGVVDGAEIMVGPQHVADLLQRPWPGPRPRGPPTTAAPGRAWPRGRRPWRRRASRSPARPRSCRSRRWYRARSARRPPRAPTAPWSRAGRCAPRLSRCWPDSPASPARCCAPRRSRRCAWLRGRPPTSRAAPLPAPRSGRRGRRR